MGVFYAVSRLIRHSWYLTWKQCISALKLFWNKSNRIDGLLKDVVAQLTLKHRCTIGIGLSHTHTQMHAHTHRSLCSSCNQCVYTRCQEISFVLTKSIGWNEECQDNALNSIDFIIRLQTTHTHKPVVCRRPLTRTDRVNGDEDRGVKQRSEIWRQEETESQNTRGGSRGMEHRMKLTDIKTARTHRESFPFLRANIQRLVGGGGRELERECLSRNLERINL